MTYQSRAQSAGATTGHRSRHSRVHAAISALPYPATREDYLKAVRDALQPTEPTTTGTLVGVKTDSRTLVFERLGYPPLAYQRTSPVVWAECAVSGQTLRWSQICALGEPFTVTRGESLD